LCRIEEFCSLCHWMGAKELFKVFIGYLQHLSRHVCWHLKNLTSTYLWHLLCTEVVSIGVVVKTNDCEANIITYRECERVIVTL